MLPPSTLHLQHALHSSLPTGGQQKVHQLVLKYFLNAYKLVILSFSFQTPFAKNVFHVLTTPLSCVTEMEGFLIWEKVYL